MVISPRNVCGSPGFERLPSPTSPLARATASALAEYQENPYRNGSKYGDGEDEDVDSVVSWMNESRKNSFEIVIERAKRAEELIGVRLPSTADICKRNDYHARCGQRWKDEIKIEREGRSDPKHTAVNAAISHHRHDVIELPKRPRPAILKEETRVNMPRQMPSPKPDSPFVPGEVVILTSDKFFNACHFVLKKQAVDKDHVGQRPRKKTLMSTLKHFLHASP